MRVVLRYAVAAVSALMVGLLIFTAETVVDEVGYTNAIRAVARDWWSAMLDAGYSDWLFVGTVFSIGATVGAWLHWAASKYDARKEKTARQLGHRLALAARVLADIEQEIDTGGGKLSAKAERQIAQIRALLADIQALGVPTPVLDYTGLEFVRHARVYASLVAPPIVHGHMSAAKEAALESVRLPEDDRPPPDNMEAKM